jgi:restriction endonuclease S subunit
MSTRTVPLSEGLIEVSSGVGPAWTRYRVLGATRGGLALAKEPVGKAPERYKLVEPGTIFYNPMRIMIGSIAMVDDGDEPGITSPDYVVVRPRPGVLHHRWFYHWLRSQQGAEMIRSLARGAVRERLLFKRLARGVITIPEWDSQVRAAGSLAIIQKARAAAAAQLEAAKALPVAYLREAFQGPTPLSVDLRPRITPRGWAWRLLSTVAKLESGHTPSRYHPEYWKGQIPWIALPDIRAMDGRLAYDTQEHVNEEGIANSSARILPAGTVVLSRTASVGFVTIMGRPMATSQDFVNWVCGPELYPPFLAFLLRAARDHFRGLASGAIHKTVYMPTVKALRISMPEIETQRRIAAHLEVKLRESDRLLAESQNAASEFSAMPTAILNQCFEGKN